MIFDLANVKVDPSASKTLIAIIDRDTNDVKASINAIAQSEPATYATWVCASFG